MARGIGGLDRRGLMLAAAGLLATPLPALGSQTTFKEKAGKMTGRGSYLAYVGARTTRERNARGDGINVYRVDAATAAWTHLQLVGDLLNPSFLAFDNSGGCLYTVHGDSDQVSAFRVGTDGRLSFLNRQSTGGKNPVHLAFDPSNRWLVVANHITSTLAVLPRAADGSLGPLAGLTPLSGPLGPHRVEQPFAKPHQVVFDPTGRFLAVPDKGLDRTFCFRLDAGTGQLLPAGEPALAREGAGPRHIAFHPSQPFAYVLNELDSSLTALGVDAQKGALTPFQIIPSLPDSFTANSRASEVALSADGRFLYASNRGHDSIGIFAVDAGSGRLSPVEWQPSRGQTPRFFALSPDGSHLFVANEGSDTIVAFAVDVGSGRLTPTGDSVKVGSPVCILFGPDPAGRAAP